MKRATRPRHEEEFSSEGLTSDMLSGMIWVGGSSGVQSVMRVIVVAVLARLLFPEDFGLMGAVLNEYIVARRYPGDLAQEDIGSAESHEALSVARRIRKAVRNAGLEEE